MLLAGVIALTGCASFSTSTSANSDNAGVSASSNSGRSTSSVSGNSGSGAPSNLTQSQQNAYQAAQNYLQDQGFSKQGLINQLSSSSGDGYSVHDATVAVDSLNVDWNAEAVKSAKDYLKDQSFSCQGLVEQLSSSAGDNYTEEQAQYAAHKVGLC